ncbi:hemolysin family protein [Actinotalea sp.]|uniref:hemolysin family protein n=1 Tax=Actinotalea sp. TaxID=1872145 RepID=UPI002B6A1856|nr:hemolysin family protein [Actinotalea sp.]HRA50564.1 hemolysin family protein [Actinotalea sp.]
MTTDWWMVVLGVVLTAGTAVFVAAEFALVTLDPGLVERQVASRPGDRRAQSVRRALAELSTQLSGAQVGITVTTILLGYTTQPALANLLAGPLGSTPLSRAAAAGTATVLALVLVNGFSMLFGELVPKNLALSSPMPTARAVAPLQRGFTLALRPVITMLNGSANALLRRFGVEPREELSGGRSATELVALVRRSAEIGTLDRGTATLLTNSIELDTLTAADVMTDRTRLEVVRRDDSAADVLALARRTGHSRFPVIDTSHDDVVGLVHLRRAIAVPYERRAEVPAAALMDEAPRVPETVRLGPLLVELREYGMQMAMVVDEYGGTAGVVTLEDVIEELVGEVADEHDLRRAGARRAADGTWTVPGLLRPDELAEQTRLVVPDDGAYETLGGLVMALLGRVPRQGDLVRVADVELRVEAMDGRRIDRLRVRALPEEVAP